MTGFAEFSKVLLVVFVFIDVNEAQQNDSVRLIMFTRDAYYDIVYGDLNSLAVAGFDSSKPTNILIHGWMGTVWDVFPNTSITAYLASADINVNVLGVDWSKQASYVYPAARAAVDPVGRFLAVVVDWLVKQAGVSTDSVHVIGHSLGAHIGGVIGERVTVGQIGRISGLDPAGPGFTPATSGRLDSSDAQFVDVIHTCGGLLGYYNPCGHVDFYPNKGTYNQPGCPTVESGLPGKCSHFRSIMFYAESISSKRFVATPCDSWQDFANGVCDGNATAVMGEYVDSRVRGNYYLYTAGSPPYALG